MDLRAIIDLNESSASRRRMPIRMVDLTDGYTPETGLTITTEISLNGGAFAATVNSFVEVSDGEYYVELDTTEVATAGRYRLKASDGMVAARDDLFSIEVTDGVRVKAIDASPVTSIQSGLALAAALAAVDAKLPAALIGGRMSSVIGASQPSSLAANAFTGAAIAAIQSGLATAVNLAALSARVPSALIGDAIRARVMSVETDAITDDGVASDVMLAIANAIFEENLAAHVTPNTLGERMNRVQGLATSGLLTASSFETDLSGYTANDWFKRSILLWAPDATLFGQVSRISAFNFTTQVITVQDPFTAAPADGDRFLIINQ